MATTKKRRGRVRPRAADQDLSQDEGEGPRATRQTAAQRQPGSERPGGVMVARSAWERGHILRMKNRDNVYLVRATTTGYYNHRLWREGEEFKMAIDPKLEPPRWVVCINKPGGKVIGVPAKGGGIDEMDALPYEDQQEMPLDGRGSAAKARMRELEDEEDEEERSSRRARKRARQQDEDEDEEEEE